MTTLSSVIDIVLLARNGRPLMPHINKTEWGLRIVSILLAGVGIFFLALSLDLSLRNQFLPETAALISSLVVFAIACVAMLLGAHYRRAGKKSAAPVQEDLVKILHGLIEDALKELDGPVRENPKTAVLLAAIAGFLVANHRPS